MDSHFFLSNMQENCISFYQEEKYSYKEIQLIFR